MIFLRPRDIEKIEIDGRSLDDARYQTRTVDVSLGSNWIDSGVDLKRSERVRVDATGTIYAGRMRITPAGLNTTDPSAPLPRAAEGELIGVIGNELRFTDHRDWREPRIRRGSRRPSLSDRKPQFNYNDARGVFKAQIRKEVDLAAMARADDNRTNQNDDSYDPFGYPGDSGSGPAATRSRERAAAVVQAEIVTGEQPDA